MVRSPRVKNNRGVADQLRSSSVLQDMDALNIPLSKKILHAFMTILLTPVCNMVEGILVIWAIFQPAQGFHIVKKL